MGNNWAGAFLSAMLSFGPIGLFHESIIQKEFYEKISQKERTRITELQRTTLFTQDLIVWKNGNVFMVTMDSRPFNPWITTNITRGPQQIILGSAKTFSEIERIVRVKDPEYEKYFKIFSEQ